MFNKKLFAKRFKELREKANLNQKDCAEKLGISRGSISFYENGDRLPDIETIYAMADFFNVSADYLIGKTDNSTTNVDLQGVCQYTGLSDSAATKLHLIEDLNDHLLSAYAYPRKNSSGENLFRVILTGEDLDKLNFLIEDDEFYNLLYFIREYSRTRLNKDLNTPDFESLSDIDKTVAIAEYSDLDDHENLMLFRAQQTFIDIIKNIGTRTIKESKNYHQLPLFKNETEE